MARTSSLRAHTWGCEVQLPQPPGKLLAHVLAIEHHYHLLVRLLQKNCLDVLLQSVTMEKNEVHCCHQHAVTCGVASLRRVQTVVLVALTVHPHTQLAQVYDRSVGRSLVGEGRIMVEHGHVSGQRGRP